MANKRARELRATLTDAERRLWACLRNRRFVGFKFRRQHRWRVRVAKAAHGKSNLSFRGNTAKTRRDSFDKTAQL